MGHHLYSLIFFVISENSSSGKRKKAEKEEERKRKRSFARIQIYVQQATNPEHIQDRGERGGGKKGP